VNDAEMPASTAAGEMVDTGEAPPSSATQADPKAAIQDEAVPPMYADVREHPDQEYSLAELKAAPIDIDVSGDLNDEGGGRLTVPLVHLVLSISVLAASLIYFAERSATGLGGLFESILSMINGNI